MRRIASLLVLLTLITLWQCSRNTSVLQVKVEGGRIEGVEENGITVFKGIPFAAPPVGDLRWRPPWSAC